jgi:hypothetical protein
MFNNSAEIKQTATYDIDLSMLNDDCGNNNNVNNNNNNNVFNNNNGNDIISLHNSNLFNLEHKFLRIKQQSISSSSSSLSRAYRKATTNQSPLIGCIEPLPQ